MGNPFDVMKEINQAFFGNPAFKSNKAIRWSEFCKTLRAAVDEFGLENVTAELGEAIYEKYETTSCEDYSDAYHAMLECNAKVALRYEVEK